MKPKEFAQKNSTFTLPGGEQPLAIYKDDKHLISCWEFEGKEKLLVLFNGVVWLRVWGKAQPPVLLEATYPFLDENGKVPDIDAIINQFVERKVKQFLAPQEKDLTDESRKFAENILVAFLHFVFVTGEEKV